MVHNKYGTVKFELWWPLCDSNIFLRKINEILSILLIESNRTLFQRLPNPLSFWVRRCLLFAPVPPAAARKKVAYTLTWVRVKLWNSLNSNSIKQTNNRLLALLWQMPMFWLLSSDVSSPPPPHPIRARPATPPKSLSSAIWTSYLRIRHGRITRRFLPLRMGYYSWRIALSIQMWTNRTL